MSRYGGVFVKFPECLVPPPPPPSTGALDRTYVHNSLTKIRYIDTQLFKLPKPQSPAERRSNFDYATKLQAIKHVIYTHVEQHIDAHLAYKCRCLLRAVYDTLPPELREMIYSSIFSGFHIDVTMNQLNLIPKGRTKPRFSTKFINSFANSESYDFASANYGHVFKTTYADDIVRRELINTWYRVTTFNFDSGSASGRKYPDYVSQIVNLFKHDRWGTGVDLHEVIKSVRITYDTITTSGTHRLMIDRPLLKLPLHPRTGVSMPAAKLNPNTKITLYVDKTDCGCRDNSCVDLNTEMRKAFALLDQTKVLLEHGYTVWIDLAHRLKFQAKMEELNEKCWAEKAAAEQARLTITTRCRESWKM